MAITIRTNKTMTYIGKRVPKGFEELPGSIHMGKGIWMFAVKPKEKPKEIKAKSGVKSK